MWEEDEGRQLRREEEGGMGAEGSGRPSQDRGHRLCISQGAGADREIWA